MNCLVYWFWLEEAAEPAVMESPRKATFVAFSVFCATSSESSLAISRASFILEARREVSPSLSTDLVSILSVAPLVTSTAPSFTGAFSSAAESVSAAEASSAAESAVSAAEELVSALLSEELSSLPQAVKQAAATASESTAAKIFLVIATFSFPIIKLYQYTNYITNIS